MAELVDATDLGSVARKGVEVQVLSSAWPGVGPAWARGLVGRRLLCTEEIVGSNPTGSTSQVTNCRFRGRSSAVDRLLAKEKVVGSNPIARSKARHIARAIVDGPSLAVAEVAQLVEHLTENQGVPSSSLGLGIS